jgi:hypothetical protein
MLKITINAFFFALISHAITFSNAATFSADDYEIPFQDKKTATRVDESYGLFQEEMNRDDKSHIINSIREININEQEDVLTRAKAFLRKEMSADDVSAIIGVIHCTHPLRRDDVLPKAKTLIHKQMNGDDIVDIINVLNRLDPLDVDKVLALSQRFIRKETTGDAIANIIIEISKFNMHDQRFCMLLTNQLYRDEMDEDNFAYIIDYISKIEAFEVTRSTARTLLWTHAVTALHNYNNLMARIMQTPLKDKIVLEKRTIDNLLSADNPYKFGINVHDDKRDERTLNAIEVLQKSWSPKKAEINATWADFWKHVKALKNDPRKPDILRSLGVDSNGSIKNDEDDIFNGLLAGYQGMVSLDRGLEVNAKELIARFWHFANTYAPVEGDSAAAENENLRQSVLTGIANGFKHNGATGGYLVCDTGKIQNLAVLTLQGRLKDKDGLVVDIDNLGLNDEVIDGLAIKNVSNLREIAFYLQPFVDHLTAQGQEGPKTADAFFLRLFCYNENLAAGNVAGFKDQRIRLNASEVVYYVRMMAPVATGVPLELNPEASLFATYCELFDYPENDQFRIDDYVRQFGKRDQKLLNKANAEEAQMTMDRLKNAAKEAKKRKRDAQIEEQEIEQVAPGKKLKPLRKQIKQVAPGKKLKPLRKQR